MIPSSEQHKAALDAAEELRAILHRELDARLIVPLDCWVPAPPAGESP